MKIKRRLRGREWYNNVMRLPKELTTVTTLSKSVALLMFILLPIIGFLFGMQYQSKLMDQSVINNPPVVMSPTPKLIGCTMDAKICPDGTAVGRVAPDCQFEECKNTAKFSCPKNEYVNCMPSPDTSPTVECSQAFLQWAEKNCPNFKGAAY